MWRTCARRVSGKRSKIYSCKHVSGMWHGVQACDQACAEHARTRVCWDHAHDGLDDSTVQGTAGVGTQRRTW